ncbi:unnamed protein product, partial [Ectocarpus sp. 12 AP-2014]
AEKTEVVSPPFVPGADNGSDVPLRRQSSGSICSRRTVSGANAGVRQRAVGGRDDDADELLDLEIEIPVPGEAEEERVGAAVGDIERFAGNGEEEASRQRVNTLTSEDADVENASLHSWYQASDRPDRDSEEDNDKEEQEEQEQETEEAQDEHTSKTTESAAAAAEHSAGSKNGDAGNGSTDAHKQAERGKGKERGGWHAPSDSPRFPRSPANSPAAGAGHHP